MQLRLRTKFTLVMTSLVLLVVAVLSGVFAAQLLDQLIRETDKRASDLAEQVFLQARHALTEAAQQGRTLPGLGIDPAAFQAIVPTYLWRFRKTGQFRRRPA